jgi:hypothetical protein
MSGGECPLPPPQIHPWDHPSAKTFFQSAADALERAPRVVIE